MRNAWAICRRELLSFFVSPVAYIVITGFLLLAAYFFFVLLAQFNGYLIQYQQMPFMSGGNQPNLNQWVVEPYYHTLLVFLVFLVPVLTMRLLPEEKRRGTFELLATSPLSVGEIVFGKFLSVAFVIVTMMVLMFAFPLILCYFGNPEILPVVSGLLGMILCGLAFAALSMAASSFTDNQLVGVVVGIVLLLLLYVIHAFGQAMGSGFEPIFNALSPVMEIRDLIRGVISLKSVLYFLSLIAVGLFLSLRALEAHRWR